MTALLLRKAVLRSGRRLLALCLPGINLVGGPTSLDLLLLPAQLPRSRRRHTDSLTSRDSVCDKL